MTKEVPHPEPPTRAVQDYLKAIHSLGGAERMVSPVDIAARLEVRAPSVTGMLKRLAEAGWIRYEPGHGAQLSELGIAEARRVIRRHRLIELFLTRTLQLKWDEVHEEAENLEHAVSDRLIDRIDAYLGHPQADPHGDPIPAADGSLRPDASCSLAQVQPGARFRLSRVLDQSPEFLRFLSDSGLAIGSAGRARMACAARHRPA